MINQEQAVEALGNMTVLQIIELTKQLEQQWGVEAKPQAIQFFAPVNESKVDMKTEFDIHLLSVPADKKISVIKALREVLGLGLVECKSLVESLPKMIKEGISEMEAERIKQLLTDAGSLLEVK